MRKKIDFDIENVSCDEILIIVISKGLNIKISSNFSCFRYDLLLKKCIECNCFKLIRNV